MDTAEVVAHLEALADPNRYSLLDALLLDGPLDAGDLGRRVKDARSSLTYHLGVLERAGLIRRRDDGAWEATGKPLIITAEMSDDPELKRLLGLVEQSNIDRRAERNRSWAVNRTRRKWSEWSDHSVSRDYMVPGLLPEDLDEFDERVDTLIREFKERGVNRDDSVGEAVTITVVAHPLRGAD